MTESITPVQETETVIKNEYDFRREILKALDKEFPSPADAKDTELFRTRLLYALHQVFDQDDIKQTDRFRGKLVKGISELSGGGGGGDFSTAQVTINGPVELDVAWCSSDPEDDSSTYGHINESGTYTVILFKGNAFINASAVIGNITINGNIEEVDDKMYNVTGNCTITVTP